MFLRTDLRRPRSSLFPYTTLFRSEREGEADRADRQQRGESEVLAQGRRPDQAPHARRSARYRGRPPATILRWAASTSYGTRLMTIAPRSASQSAYAARGSRSRGWPTLPTFTR